MHEMLAYAQAVHAVSPALCNLVSEYFSSRLCVELVDGIMHLHRYSSPYQACVMVSPLM